MRAERIWELVTAEDPLVPLVTHLREGIWTRERYEQARAADDLQGYLVQGEHAESTWEKQVYDVYSDMYGILEHPHPLKRRIDDEVLGLEEFTLVVLDALSLRELPAVLRVLEEAGLAAEASYALSTVPSETSVFCHSHFGANGPAQLAGSAKDLAVRLTKTAADAPDFSASERRRLVWIPFPDTAFGMDHAAIDYGKQIIEPVVSTLASVLASQPLLPLFITSDHGYVWQGGDAYWGLPDDEARVLAQHMKAGRATDEATVALSTLRGKAWVSGQTAAARGRFAWGKFVTGATRLYKHGGVSLMECVVPWVTCTATDACQEDARG